MLDSPVAPTAKGGGDTLPVMASTTTIMRHPDPQPHVNTKKWPAKFGRFSGEVPLRIIVPNRRYKGD